MPEERGLGSFQTVAIVTLCTVAIMPSVLFNIASAASAGGVAANVAQMSLGLGLALAAPASTFACKSLIQQRDFFSATFAAILFAISLWYGLTSAVGNAALVREDAAQSRLATSVSSLHLSERRERVTADLNKARERSGGATADMASHELAALQFDQRWNRSRQCTDVTLQDSRDFCTIHAGAKARMEAAKLAEGLRQELAGIDLAIETPSGRVTADPQAANLTALAGLFIARVDERWVSVLLNTRTAVAAELLGALGPMVFVTVILSARRRKHVAEPPLLLALAEAAPEPVLEEVCTVELFVEACVVKNTDSEVRAKILYDAYRRWGLENGHPPLIIHGFSKRMSELGFEKRKQRNVFYIGIQLATRSKQHQDV